MKTNVLESIAEIRALQDKAHYLTRKLHRSLDIEALCPDAFEHGEASSRVVGNSYHPERCKFIVVRGDGSQRSFPLLDVPRHLWETSRALFDNQARGRIKAWKKE